MENLEIYEKVRHVPEKAKKTIQAGRLKGMTDVNPMYRIKTLTDVFGPCGIGWKYVITEKRLETAPNGEVKAFVDINLYVKYDGEWSEAIPGTGGSAFISNEKNGPYVSDECFKMALTDAISVSCKALGVGADVYWDADRTKYSEKPETPAIPSEPTIKCADCGKVIAPKKHSGKLYKPSEIAENSKRVYGVELCWDCCGARRAAGKEGAEGF